MQRKQYDVLHLGCGQDYHEDAWNVDAEESVDPDEVYNLAELPWPWPDNSFEEIRAYHVMEHLPDIEMALRESKRILEPGGRLEIRIPMGNDALADPAHAWGKGNPWMYRTPLFYTGERHWDIDVGLDVVSRDVEVWPLHPTIYLKAVKKLYWQLLRKIEGDGEWLFSLSQMSGEFTVVFKNDE